MDKELEKDNSQNPEEEVTPEEPEKEPEQPQSEPEEAPEETPPEEKKTPKEKPESPKEEYTDREKRYYARMKKAEEEAKTAKAAATKSKKPVSDIDAILEVQQATKGLEPDEVTELKFRAGAKGISLLEARKDENFVLWQTAYQKKVEDNKKTPEASNKSSVSEKPLAEITKADVDKMTDEEKDEYWTKTGWLKPRKKSPTERLRETK